ncbi:MAG: DUF177 domain-containing protein [Candidatus Gastranaerophilales bacterium]|nr:DUF177 domain-containing protein [Candidatus Gastranaerophilales bacterium]
MLVNLSDVLTSSGKVFQVEVPLELDSLRTRMGVFPIREKEPAAFVFTNIGEGKASVTGSVRLKFETRCDRCLAETVTELFLSFDRIVTAPDVDAEEDEDSRECMEGYQLNAEAFVYNEILVNWPVKILCREDCKGVCPKCGQNLNMGDCGCDTFVPDPRMAAIKDIFNGSKEV